jgi:hypothetical protein
MDNGTLLKKINMGSRVVFDDSGRFYLVLKGKINTVAPGKRQEVGPGGVIDSSMYAYAIENSELQALYVIGELNKRLGNIKKAHEYFLKVLHYKGHNMAILTDLARDGLQELKQMTKETA